MRQPKIHRLVEHLTSDLWYAGITRERWAGMSQEERLALMDDLDLMDIGAYEDYPRDPKGRIKLFTTLDEQLAELAEPIEQNALLLDEFDPRDRNHPH